MKTTAHEGQALNYLQEGMVITGTSSVTTTLTGRMSGSTSQESDQPAREALPNQIYLSIPPGKSISREVLHEYFSKIGEVTHINCMSEGRPFAFIAFRQDETVRQLLLGPTTVEVNLQVKEAFRNGGLKRKNFNKSEKKYKRSAKRARKFFQKKKELRLAAEGCSDGK